MNDITFTSRFSPVIKLDFAKKLSAFGKECLVDSPWRTESAKVGQDVYTMGVEDCSICLITDGKKALLMHLDPTNADNHNLKKLYKFMSERINLQGPDTQAVVVGSRMNNKDSQDIFNNFISLLQKFKIPTSILKYGIGKTNFAYRTATDEILITNAMIDSAISKGFKGKDALESGFGYVKISEFDEVV